jgi:arabinoxylan arabinofuranohydrolase
MKNVILALSILLAALVTNAQNPICPIGTYIADPTARVWADGNLYIYGSTDESKDYWCSYKHDVLYTADLKNWKIQTDVFSTKGSNDAVKETDALLYAPDAMYRNSMYYLYFCTPDKKYSEGVAISKSPLGPFTQAKKLNIGKQEEIDPTIFVDDDGQAYYYWGQFKLKGAKMKSNMTELDDSSIRDSLIDYNEHFFHEGAFVFKRKGIYYILYAHEGRRDRRPTCLGYATSNSPLGPFIYRGIVIDNFGCDPETWNNHGSIAEFKGQWYVFYHRSSHASQVMRRACVEPISFNADGSIDEVEMTSQGAAKSLDAFVKIEAERACMLNGYCRIKRVSLDNESLSSVKTGDWAAYKYLDFGKGVSSFTVSAHSDAGGYINIRIGSPAGRIIGTVQIKPLSKRLEYDAFSCKVDLIKGVNALYLEFIGIEQGAKLFDIDSFQFD